MDTLKNLRKSWESFAEENPHWAVLTARDSGETDAFYESGIHDVESVLKEGETQQIEINKGAALDFGCGVGRLTFPLCAHFEKVVAADISTKMIELAGVHENCPANASFYNVKDSKLSGLDRNSFDFVLSLIVLQHLPTKHAKSYIKAFMRVARFNGLIVFQIPTARKKIETGKPIFWADKPLTWDNPSFGKLCYRCVSRTIMWPRRRLRLPILSNELRHRLDCLWRKVAGKPIMLMNFLRIDQIKNIAKKNGCEIVAIKKDDRTGEGYTSNLFFIRKIQESE